jgi:hypothetical protein
MRSVKQAQLKEMPERPHRVGGYRNHSLRGRYVPDRGGDRAGQSTAHAGRQAGGAEIPIAEISIVSNGKTLEKLGGRMLGLGLSRPEFRRLGAQCSILFVIAGIVSWLIAA